MYAGVVALTRSISPVESSLRIYLWFIDNEWYERGTNRVGRKGVGIYKLIGLKQTPHFQQFPTNASKM